MAMQAGSSGGVNSEINVTPMIDVLLVLLIIFMVVIALGRTAVQITIPPPDTGTRDQAASNQIVLELRDDGSYWVNGRQVNKPDLPGFLTDLYKDRPAKLIFLKPGPNRIYGEVIDAVDVARGAGVEVVGVTPIEAN